MTREQAIENHRKMWAWIADETQKRKVKITKEDFFSEHNIDMSIHYHCYLCDYAAQESGTFDLERCYRCPLDWGILGTCTCVGIGSLYNNWYQSIDWRICAELAEKIANLKEKENKDDNNKTD